MTREPNGGYRLWFCRTHLAAYEMLETLQKAGRALDRLAESHADDEGLDDARFAVRASLHKARPREPW